jgi:hypothetical protein
MESIGVFSGSMNSLRVIDVRVIEVRLYMYILSSLFTSRGCVPGNRDLNRKDVNGKLFSVEATIRHDAWAKSL